MLACGDDRQLSGQQRLNIHSWLVSLLALPGLMSIPHFPLVPSWATFIRPSDPVIHSYQFVQSGSKLFLCFLRVPCSEKCQLSSDKNMSDSSASPDSETENKEQRDINFWWQNHFRAGCEICPGRCTFLRMAPMLLKGKN